jgi:hypothetical protein
MDNECRMGQVEWPNGSAFSYKQFEGVARNCERRRRKAPDGRVGGGRKILKINSLDAISWHLTTKSSIYKNSRRREMIRGQFFLVGEK